MRDGLGERRSQSSPSLEQTASSQGRKGRGKAADRSQAEPQNLCGSLNEGCEVRRAGKTQKDNLGHIPKKRCFLTGKGERGIPWSGEEHEGEHFCLQSFLLHGDKVLLVWSRAQAGAVFKHQAQTH